jgi:predicted transposase/invertase (TIGR01784 family)
MSGKLAVHQRFPKKQFGDPGNNRFLVSFLQSVLDLPKEEYDRVEIADPNLQREYEEDKLSVVDVRIHTKSGKIVNIEVQVADTREIRERVIYSNAKSIAVQLHAGNGYFQLKKVISIQITDFVLLGEEEGYHNVYKLGNVESHKVLSELAEIHILELSRIPEGTTIDDMLVNWMRFLSSKNEKEVDMAVRAAPIIKEAGVRLKQLSEDERMQLLEARRIKFEYEQWDIKHTAYEDGRDEGIEEGIEKVAGNLKRIGMPIEQIMETTGLSKEEIYKL